MSGPLNGVVYRPHQHAEEFIVFVDDIPTYHEWKEQPDKGKDIALARFVGSFEIYRSDTGGTSGQLNRISQQEMETNFFPEAKKGEKKTTEDAMKIILQNGYEQPYPMKAMSVDINTSRTGAGDVHPGVQRR